MFAKNSSRSLAPDGHTNDYATKCHQQNATEQKCHQQNAPNKMPPLITPPFYSMLRSAEMEVSTTLSKALNRVSTSECQKTSAIDIVRFNAVLQLSSTMLMCRFEQGWTRGLLDKGQLDHGTKSVSCED